MSDVNSYSAYSTYSQAQPTGMRVRLRRRRWTIGLAGLSAIAVGAAGVLVNGGSPASAATSVPNATLSPQGVSVTAGSSVDIAVRLSSSRPSKLTGSLRGQPAGVTGTISCASSRDCVLQIVASSTAPEATNLAYVVLRNGSRVRQIPLALHVTSRPTTPTPTTTPPSTTPPTAPPTTTATSRTLSIRPEAFSATTRPGARTTFVINLVRNGWTDPVDLTLEGLPQGWRAAFLQNPVSASTTLVVDSSSDSRSGEYPLRIVGRAGGTSAESVVIVRLRPPEISLTLTTPGASVAPGGATRFVVNARSSDDSGRPVTLRVEGLPTGATPTILPNPASGTANVDVSVLGTVAPGNYGFQIVAALDGVEVRLAAVLTVATQSSSTFQFTPTPVAAVPGQSRGYGLAVTNGAVNAPAGGFASFDVTVSPTGGFTDLINMSVSPPSGWTVSWFGVSPNVVRVTVGVPLSAPKTGTSIQLLTSSGTLSASLGLTVNVT